MKRLFLSIALISIASCLHGELLNHEMQPAANGMEVATWQPKPSLIPLLDKFYIEVSQVDHTYQANADFMFSFAGSFHQWKSEEEKLEAQRSHKYLSIYLRFALYLLREREDLVKRYISFSNELLNIKLTEDEFWESLFNSYVPEATPEFKISFFFMYDVLFEQEVEKYVETSLKDFYQI